MAPRKLYGSKFIFDLTNEMHAWIIYQGKIQNKPASQFIRDLIQADMDKKMKEKE